ncbi:MAG: hypothetical protein ACRYFS_26810 [Janthinobacterium lividum]
MIRNHRAGTCLLLALLAVAVAGCSPHDAAPPPPGMKVGPPLTQEQVQAIQRKRATAMGN